MDYKELKRKESLFEIIDDVVGGMDVYNHNDSLWIINTNESRWAIEFNKNKILWFNFGLFKTLFKSISLDVTNNETYITEWFESRFIKPEVVEDTIQNGVKHTALWEDNNTTGVEDTIQNGVKQTDPISRRNTVDVEDTIQNGVKHTTIMYSQRSNFVEDTIQNGVKETELHKGIRPSAVEDTIQNGVKETKKGIGIPSSKVDDTIEYGVKRTRSNYWIAPEFVTDAIQCGVKETIPTLRRTLLGVDDILQNGVKVLQPLPAQDGNMDWGVYYHEKEDRTKPFNEYLNETIKFGVIKKKVNQTFKGDYSQVYDVYDVIENGILI